MTQFFQKNPITPTVKAKLFFHPDFHFLLPTGWEFCIFLERTRQNLTTENECNEFLQAAWDLLQNLSCGYDESVYAIIKNHFK